MNKKKRLQLTYILIMLCVSVLGFIIYLEATSTDEVVVSHTCENNTSLKKEITILKTELDRLEEENQVLGSCCAQNEIPYP